MFNLLVHPHAFTESWPACTLLSWLDVTSLWSVGVFVCQDTCPFEHHVRCLHFLCVAVLCLCVPCLKSLQSCQTIHIVSSFVCSFYVMFRKNPSQRFTCYEPNASRSSLDEPDMSMGTAGVLRSNTVPPGLGADLNLQGSTERGSASDPRLIMSSDTSETAPQPTPQATVDIATLGGLMQMFKSLELRGYHNQVPNDLSLTRRRGSSGTTYDCDRRLGTA